MKKIILYVAAFCILQSCGAVVKSGLQNRLTEEKGAIPADLGSDDAYVVGILQERNSRDKYLKKYFKKNYKGKYIFLTQKQLDTEKYRDSTKYRYIFTYKAYTSRISTDPSKTYDISVPSSNYYIHDKKEKKDYNCGASSSYFGKYIDIYTLNLEKQRLKNKKKNI